MNELWKLCFAELAKTHKMVKLKDVDELVAKKIREMFDEKPHIHN